MLSKSETKNLEFSCLSPSCTKVILVFWQFSGILAIVFPAGMAPRETIEFDEENLRKAGKTAAKVKQSVIETMLHPFLKEIIDGNG